jgi:hypothetical protein
MEGGFMDKWYSSKLAKRGRIAHRPGHWRLGSNHSKCGHPLGKDVTSQVKAGHLDICANCEIEVLKEKERIKRASNL